MERTHIVAVGALVAGMLIAPTTLGAQQDQTPRCMGRTATIVIEQAGQTTLGTPGSDVILGTAGDDIIKGLGGNDFICGGDGNDKLLGQSGADKIKGGRGNDVLKGGAQPDRLIGGPGSDRLIGNGGADFLRGGPGTTSSTAVRHGIVAVQAQATMTSAPVMNPPTRATRRTAPILPPTQKPRHGSTSTSRCTATSPNLMETTTAFHAKCSPGPRSQLDPPTWIQAPFGRGAPCELGWR